MAGAIHGICACGEVRGREVRVGRRRGGGEEGRKREREKREEGLGKSKRN